MELLNNFLSNSTFPFLTAFILGLMTTISPCPLCTNITAIGFLSKDVKSKRSIILNGLMYAFGKIIAFTGLAAVFVLGGSVLPTQQFFETYGEMLLGPFLIIGGLFMLEFFKFHKHGSKHHESGSFSERIIRNSESGSAKWSLFLGRCALLWRFDSTHFGRTSRTFIAHSFCHWHRFTSGYYLMDFSL